MASWTRPATQQSNGADFSGYGVIGGLLSIIKKHQDFMGLQDKIVNDFILQSKNSDVMRGAKKVALATESELMDELMNNLGKLNEFLNDIILIENLFNFLFSDAQRQQQQQARKQHALSVAKYESEPKPKSICTSFSDLMFAGASVYLTSFKDFISDVEKQCKEKQIKIAKSSGARTKNIQRAFYKTFYVYAIEHGSEAHQQMTDVLRCSLVFVDFTDLYRCFSVIESMALSHSDIHGGILRCKDRYNPKTVSFGYRDLLINLYCPGSGSTIVCEVQLHHMLFYQHKKLSHRMYKRARLFEDVHTNENLAYNHADTHMRKHIGGKIYEIQEEDKDDEQDDAIQYAKLLSAWGLERFVDKFEEEGWTDLLSWTNGDLTDDDLYNMGLKKGHIKTFKRNVNAKLKVSNAGPEVHLPPVSSPVWSVPPPPPPPPPSVGKQSQYEFNKSKRKKEKTNERYKNNVDDDNEPLTPDPSSKMEVDYPGLLERAKAGNQIPVTIYLINGMRCKQVHVTTQTLTREVFAILAIAFSFRHPEAFGLFLMDLALPTTEEMRQHYSRRANMSQTEKINDLARMPFERELSDNDCFLDVVESWLTGLKRQKDNGKRQKKKKGLRRNKKNVHFVLKVKALQQSMETEFSLMGAKVNFLTHVWHVVNDFYPIVDEEFAFDLAALQLQGTFGPRVTAYELTQYLPQSVLNKYSSADRVFSEQKMNDMPSDCARVEQKILQLRSTRYINMLRSDCWIRYAKMLRSNYNKYFGSSWYRGVYVRDKSDQGGSGGGTEDSDLLVGITEHAFTMVSPLTQKIMHRYQLEEILTFGYRSDAFLLVCGSLMSQTKIQIFTMHGETMNGLFKTHINLLVRDAEKKGKK